MITDYAIVFHGLILAIFLTPALIQQMEDILHFPLLLLLHFIAYGRLAISDMIPCVITALHQICYDQVPIEYTARTADFFVKKMIFFAADRHHNDWNQ